MMRTSLAALKRRYARYLPVSGMLAFSVLIAVLLVRFGESVERLGDWGYAGAFLIMLINNATIILPAVGHALLVAAAQSLDPVLLGVIGGLGGTLGELTGYVLGMTGRRVVSGESLDRRLRRIPRKLFGPALFVFAATPLPFDVAGILAGTMRFPVWRFLLWAGLGKIVNTVGIVVAGYYAIDWLQRLVGPSG